MQLYYFDKASNYMSMETPDTGAIQREYIVRICHGTSNAKFIIAEPEDIRDMQKKIKTKADKFQYHTGTMTMLNDNPKDWDISELPDFGMHNSDIELAKKQALEFWIRMRTDRTQYTFIQTGCNLGMDLYYKDIQLENIHNNTVHLFGKGKIFANKISNCLIYIHGDYEIIKG